MCLIRHACYIGLFAFLLSACNQHDSHKFKIGTNVWIGYEPLYLAREVGYLNNQQFKLVEYTSASQVIRSYRNGAIDIAALTMDEVLLLKENGLDPRVILVMDISHGGDVIMTKPSIKKFKDLKGKVIGVEKTALGAYLLSRALDLNGLSFQDIKTKHVDLALHEKSFLNKDIDAVVTFEPVKSHLLKNKANIVFDSTQIPNEIVDVLVVRGELINKHPEELKALIKSWFTALKYIEQYPENSATIIAPRMKIEAKKVLASFEGLIFPDQKYNKNLLLSEQGDPTLAKNTRKLLDVMIKQQTIKNSMDTNELFVDVSKLY